MKRRDFLRLGGGAGAILVSVAANPRRALETLAAEPSRNPGSDEVVPRYLLPNKQAQFISFQDAVVEAKQNQIASYGFSKTVSDPRTIKALKFSPEKVDEVLILSPYNKLDVKNIQAPSGELSSAENAVLVPKKDGLYVLASKGVSLKEIAKPLMGEGIFLFDKNLSFGDFALPYKATPEGILLYAGGKPITDDVLKAVVRENDLSTQTLDGSLGTADVRTASLKPSDDIAQAVLESAGCCKGDASILAWKGRVYGQDLEVVFSEANPDAEYRAKVLGDAMDCTPGNDKYAKVPQTGDSIRFTSGAPGVRDIYSLVRGNPCP